MAFRTFNNYCHCIANAYRYFAGGPLLLQAEIQGREYMAQALAGGGGAILATGHVGNWHLGPHFLAQHGFPQVTVVMEQEPDPQVQQLEASLRDSRLRVVYPRQSPLLSLDLRAALNRGELLGFQMDRPLKNRGVRVPVADGHTTFAAGPALLARTCEVPVVPVFFPLHQGKLVVQVHPPMRARRTSDRDADLLELTTRMAAIYTGIIRRYPEQWFNFFSFWD
jgi:KDO2-lipid IV(A) lauroyltransferase